MTELDTLRKENSDLRRRLAQMSGAIARIGASLDLETVLAEIIENACELAGASYGFIVTVDEEGVAEQMVAHGLTQEEYQRLSQWPDSPALFEALRDLRGVVPVADLPQTARDMYASVGMMRARTILSAPLHHRSQHVGNFFLTEKRDGREFTSEDQEAQVLFTSLAATAIYNARTHRAEQRARADLDALIDIAPVGVVVFHAQTGQVKRVNREAKRLADRLRDSDRPHEQLLQELLLRRADGREVSLREVPLADTLRSGEFVRSEEIELSVDDGRSIRFLLNATPISSSEGVVESMVVTMQDLAPLEEMERLRTQFISMVSHELRAPLTSIKGSASTVLDASAALEREELLQFFRIIDAQANQMRVLITDLLDVGRIETGSLSVDAEPTDLVILVERARSAFLSGRTGHEILVEFPPDLPWVMADRRRIVQVFSNLFANAARFSPRFTPIRVTAERSGVYVAVSVTDEGIGILPEQLPQLFERHSRIGSEKELRPAGTGLGLAICKELVEAHGGRIRAESGGQSQGAHIVFTIPVAEESALATRRSAKEERAAAGSRQGEGSRILVVDDDPNTLRFVRDALSSEGFEPIVTAKHEDLSQIIRAEKPHLVLLDLILSGTNGIDLMDSIPELADLPVIFISGYRKDNTIARALDAGAVDYVLKPFSATELTARVRAALRRRAEPEPFVLGDLVIDYEERTVTLSGRRVHLTPTEYELLRLLSMKPGRAVHFKALVRAIWKDGSKAHSGHVRTYVMRLRRKLSASSAEPDYIMNVRGFGYKLAKPSDVEGSEEDQ